MTAETLEKINRFARRPLTEDEIYTFSVVLCDNDIDRDGERFSDDALAQLCEKFVGRTGIFDHNATTVNQTARIFDTELVTDNNRTAKTGQPYTYLRAEAYMIRTPENASLIAEIDGGIKKEVSISCSAEKRICSICGCDKANSGCSHIKGKSYGGKVCHTILSGITDTYEWSFVAVPAQVNAGVTKHYSNADVLSQPAASECEMRDELLRDIRKLAYFSRGKAAAKELGSSAESMNISQLIELKHSLEAKRVSKNCGLQLVPDAVESNDAYTMN